MSNIFLTVTPKRYDNIIDMLLLFPYTITNTYCPLYCLEGADAIKYIVTDFLKISSKNMFNSIQYIAGFNNFAVCFELYK